MCGERRKASLIPYDITLRICFVPAQISFTTLSLLLFIGLRPIRGMAFYESPHDVLLWWDFVLIVILKVGSIPVGLLWWWCNNFEPHNQLVGVTFVVGWEFEALFADWSKKSHIDSDPFNCTAQNIVGVNFMVRYLHFIYTATIYLINRSDEFSHAIWPTEINVHYALKLHLIVAQ